MSSLTEELIGKREARLAKIAALQKEADGLLVTIQILEAEEHAPTQQSLALTASPGRPRGHSRTPTSIVQKIEEIIRSRGGVAHRRDILHDLEAQGVGFTGEKEGERMHKLGAHLSNYKDRFAPASDDRDGRWKLRQP